MKEKNLNKILLLLLAFFIGMQAHTQALFKYKAALDEAATNGFYKINITPAVVAKCLPGLEDIRIFDNDNKQAAYIVQHDLPAFKKERLIEFPVIKIFKGTDKLTHVLLKNISGGPVNNLLLFIKNMDARRAFSITGSDDSVHWFIIKENIYLENAFSTDGENIIKTLSFPPSNYKYFEVVMLGENVIPFNITKAGIYNEEITYGQYIKVQRPSIIQRDSADKKSYVFIKFDDAYEINKVVIEVKGPKYFKRNFSIRRDNGNSYDYFLNDYLISDSTNSFILNNKQKQLLLTIDNDDNAPLQVKAVEAFQLSVSLLTYLQAGKKYYLYFGDSTAHFPRYDLEFFSDSVEKNPAEISFKLIEKNKSSDKTDQTFFNGNNKLMLWIVIIAVLTGLCFFTFRVIREVGNKSKQ